MYFQSWPPEPPGKTPLPSRPHFHQSVELPQLPMYPVNHRPLSRASVESVAKDSLLSSTRLAALAFIVGRNEALFCM